MFSTQRTSKITSISLICLTTLTQRSKWLKTRCSMPCGSHFTKRCIHNWILKLSLIRWQLDWPHLSAQLGWKCFLASLINTWSISKALMVSRTITSLGMCMWQMNRVNSRATFPHLMVRRLRSGRSELVRLSIEQRLQLKNSWKGTDCTHSGMTTVWYISKLIWTYNGLK
jgi:hypothetical protein